jgi:hypothetical protein
MAFKGYSLLVAVLAVSAVTCAPTKSQARQASAGVPDYVLKYGVYSLSCLLPRSRRKVL